MRVLSDDALSTLAEIEAECRDGEPWTDADFREAEAAAALANAEAAAGRAVVWDEMPVYADDDEFPF